MTNLSIAAATALACLGSQVRADCQLQSYAVLPVTMADGRADIAGSVNGVDALYFADSGAFFSILSRESAKNINLRLEPLPRGLEVRGVSGAGDFLLAMAKQFSLTGFGTVHGVEFLERHRPCRYGCDAIDAGYPRCTARRH